LRIDIQIWIHAKFICHKTEIFGGFIIAFK